MLFSTLDIAELCPLEITPNSALWPFKQSIEKLEVLREGDRYTYASQYQQNPSPLGGGMFKDAYWKYYDEPPPRFDIIRIYGDTAQKTSEKNDYSVFQCWGRYENKLYLIDQIRGKWEAPQLESAMYEFWLKHKPNLHRPNGASCVKIEDKSSGSSLIQSIQKNYSIPIEPIPRDKDKVFRAMGVVKYFASGYIYLPAHADYISDYKDEFRKFTPLMTHAHDDQIDPTMDAVEDLLIFEDFLYTDSNA